MTEQKPLRITRDALRDGSLIEMARRRVPPGMTVRSDAEIQSRLDQLLAGHQADQDVWLFGYGSLMWNPAMHFAERLGGTVRGWHRAYCLWLEGGRGSPENPGLMLALNPGGAVAGALFRIAGAHARDELLLPFRRELFTNSYDARWVSAWTPNGPVRAVTFVANRRGPRYVRGLPLERVAHHVATASGQLGTCIEYLRHTLAALEELGLDDRMLRAVHRLCVARDAANC